MPTLGRSNAGGFELPKADVAGLLCGYCGHYIGFTTVALVALMRRLQKPPRVLVSASAVGFYGASPNASMEPLDEAAPPRPGEFQSDLCAAIEHDTRRAEALGVRVVRVRFGVVLGRGGGAYPMQALSARFGLGAVLGHGRQPAPWIHLADAVGLVRFAMAHRTLQGPVNAVAPEAVTQAGFAQALAASFGRRVWLRMPGLPLRVMLGEMSTLLLDGQNAVPTAVLGQDYRFVHPRLSRALANLVGTESPEPGSARKKISKTGSSAYWISADSYTKYSKQLFQRLTCYPPFSSFFVGVLVLSLLSIQVDSIA